MRFKIDENLPVEISHLLRSHDYDSMTVMDQNLSGTADHLISKICKAEQRIIVTLDIDFADIQTYPPSEYPGIIVIRVKHQNKHHILQLFTRIMPLFKNEPLTGKLWVVDETHIRIRSA